MAADPTKQSITLTFKSSTTTLFLYTTPTSTILSIKQQLLDMLHANKAHLPKDLNLPSSVGEIIIGLPRDPLDAKKGFVDIDKPRGLAGDKTKVEIVGLKDGGVYAFRIAKEGAEEADDEEGEEDSDDGGDYDVQFPVDDYGESQGATQSQR